MSSTIVIFFHLSLFQSFHQFHYNNESFQFGGLITHFVKLQILISNSLRSLNKGGDKTDKINPTIHFPSSSFNDFVNEEFFNCFFENFILKCLSNILRVV